MAMSGNLHVLDLKYRQVVFFYFCIVPCAWFLALLFSYVAITRHTSLSSREFALIVCGLPVLYGLAAYSTYMAINHIYKIAIRIILTSSELHVLYNHGKKDIYPLDHYVFQIMPARQGPGRGPVWGWLRMSLSENYMACLSGEQNELPKGLDDDPCERCVCHASCNENEKEGKVAVYITQDNELDLLYEKILAAQESRIKPHMCG